MKQFKIRCSAIDSIMGIKALGKTGESYCQKWLKEQVYNVTREITSKYMTKGTVQELESIEYLNGLWLTDFEKNEEFHENNHLTGTPDIVTTDTVIDIKNSWDEQTFPLFEADPPRAYFLQLQGYMMLTGLKKAKLVYTLMNMPDELVIKEAWKLGINPGEDIEAFNKLQESYNYDHLPEHLRVKVYDFEYCEQTAYKIIERVEECRDYIRKISVNLKQTKQ